MKLFEAFGGILGFGKAFRRIFPNGQIVGYSEIDPECTNCNDYTPQILINHFISKCTICGKEKKQWASAVNKYNYPEVKNYGDIRLISVTEIPDFDIFTFGWPCQDNSIAGKREGQSGGKRSSLLVEAVRIIDIKKPRCFIAENVKGLYSVNEGVDFIETIKLLTYLNDSLPQYNIQVQLLNTRWILPQNRERIFFIGSLRGEPRPEIFPVSESSGKHREKGIQQAKVCSGTINQKNNSPNYQFDSGTTLVVNNRGNFQDTDVANCICSNYWKGVDNHGQRTMVMISDSGKGRKKELRNIAPPLRANTGAGHNDLIKAGTLRTHKDGDGFRVMKDGICPTIPARGREDGSVQPVIDVSGLREVRKNARKNDGKDYSPRRGKKIEERTDNLVGTITAQFSTDQLIKYSPCIRAEHHNTADVHFIPENTGIRRLTPFECSKLQGFNDISEKDSDKCWTKYGYDADMNKIIISDTQQYKMLGNAITSKLVEEFIFKQLKQSITGEL